MIVICKPCFFSFPTALQKGWLPKELEDEMMRDGGVLLFPSEPVKMKYAAFQKTFGYQPFRY